MILIGLASVVEMMEIAYIVRRLEVSKVRPGRGFDGRGEESSCKLDLAGSRSKGLISWKARVCGELLRWHWPPAPQTVGCGDVCPVHHCCEFAVRGLTSGVYPEGGGSGAAPCPNT